MTFSESLIVYFARFMFAVRLLFGIAVATLAASLKLFRLIDQPTRERLISAALGNDIGGVGR
jgi:hypothetical protein